MRPGCSGEALVEVLCAAVLAAGGELGTAYRQNLCRRIVVRDSGIAADVLFPMPLIRLQVPPRGRGRQRALRRRVAVMWANSMITVCNQLLGGPRGVLCTLSPSAAQARIQQRLLENVGRFLRGSPGPSGAPSIRTMLREDLAYGGGSRHAVELGTNAGVPDVARRACAVDLLKDFDPDAAAQIAEPQRVLLLLCDRRCCRVPILRWAPRTLTWSPKISVQGCSGWYASIRWPSIVDG